jgi:cutinase
VNYSATLDFSMAAGGVVDASRRIEDIVARCPAARIVLGGYSQGAAVAGYTTTDTVPDGFALPDGITGPMPPAIASHVAAVILFGTPSDQFLNLIDRDAPPIVIGQLYTDKTLRLCADQDPVCAPTGGLDVAAHNAYRSNGMVEQAADFAARAVSRPSP